MFNARAASVFVLAIPLLVLATNIPNTGPANQCNSGSLQCCNSVESATSSSATTALGIVGLAFGTVTGLVGLHCSSLTGIGASGTSCSQQSACCTGNSFSGLVVIGCTPINLNA